MKKKKTNFVTVDEYPRVAVTKAIRGIYSDFPLTENGLRLFNVFRRLHDCEVSLLLSMDDKSWVTKQLNTMRKIIGDIDRVIDHVEHMSSAEAYLTLNHRVETDEQFKVNMVKRVLRELDNNSELSKEELAAKVVEGFFKME